MTYWFIAALISAIAVIAWYSLGWISWEPTTLDRLRAVVKAEK